MSWQDVLKGASYAHVGRQYGLGRVTPGNWPKVFTALLQDYSANAAKVAFWPGAGSLLS